jgi:hypothetical protein
MKYRKIKPGIDGAPASHEQVDTGSAHQESFCKKIPDKPE